MPARRPPDPDANEAPDGGGHQTPYHPTGWWLGRVALDASGGRAEQVPDAPRLSSILAAMVHEALEYERQEGTIDGT